MLCWRNKELKCTTTELHLITLIWETKLVISNMLHFSQHGRDINMWLNLNVNIRITQCKYWPMAELHGGTSAWGADSDLSKGRMLTLPYNWGASINPWKSHMATVLYFEGLPYGVLSCGSSIDQFLFTYGVLTCYSSMDQRQIRPAKTGYAAQTTPRHLKG